MTAVRGKVFQEDEPRKHTRIIPLEHTKRAVRYSTQADSGGYFIPRHDDMSLSHLLHAWDLLKHGGWGGSLLGLIIGLYRQHFPWMSVLYSLKYGEGDAAIQGDRIIYKVVEVSSFPYELRQQELYLWPLFFWIIGASLVAMFLAGIISQQHAKTES